MNLTTYLRRFIKYIIYLVVVACIIYLIMSQFYTNIDIDQLISSRGLWMVAVVIFFSAVQPFFGYSSKLLTCDAQKHNEQVVNVMAMCRYKLVENRDGIMTFRANSTFHRLTLLGEDTITIDNREDGLSTMRGPRREVVKAAFRIGTYVS